MDADGVVRFVQAFEARVSRRGGGGGGGHGADDDSNDAVAEDDSEGLGQLAFCAVDHMLLSGIFFGVNTCVRFLVKGNRERSRERDKGSVHLYVSVILCESNSVFACSCEMLCKSVRDCVCVCEVSARLIWKSSTHIHSHPLTSTHIHCCGLWLNRLCLVARKTFQPTRSWALHRLADASRRAPMLETSHFSRMCCTRSGSRRKAESHSGFSFRTKPAPSLSCSCQSWQLLAIVTPTVQCAAAQVFGPWPVFDRQGLARCGCNAMP